MAKITLTVLKSKPLADGTYKIYVQLAHRSKVVYIPTRFVVKKLSHFKNGAIVGEPNASIDNVKLRNILNKYQDKIDSVESLGILTAQQLKKIISDSVNDGATVDYVTDLYLKELKKQSRDKYADMIVRSIGYFNEYTKGNFPLVAISTDVVKDYEKFLIKREKTVVDKKATKEEYKKRKATAFRVYLKDCTRYKKTRLSQATVNMAISHLKVIVNYAVSEGYVSFDKNPFNDIKINPAKVREIDLSIDDFRKIYFYEGDSKRKTFSRDMFIISFCLGGINIADLLNADLSSDYVDYARKKVKDRIDEQHIILPIVDQARKLIDKWIGKGGRISFGTKMSDKSLSVLVGKYLKKICDELSIDGTVSFTSARKTFSQFAFELGIPDSIVDYCIGHSDKGRGVIRYYSKVRKQQAEIAINRVIGYVNNPEAYKDFIEMQRQIMLTK